MNDVRADRAAATRRSSARCRCLPASAPVEAEELYDRRTASAPLPGERIIEEGAPGDSLFIVLAGELEVTKRDGDRDIVLATRTAGEFIGEMSLLEQAPRTASVRAVRDERAAVDRRRARSAECSRQIPAAATAVLRTVTGACAAPRPRCVQSDKLAALGTLAAGLAHELNNPAAAIQRSTEHLSEAFEALAPAAPSSSTRLDLSPDERTQSR